MKESRLDRRSQKERMLAGELYNGWDEELGSLRVKAHDICRRYNALFEEDRDQRRRGDHWRRVGHRSGFRGHPRHPYRFLCRGCALPGGQEDHRGRSNGPA